MENINKEQILDKLNEILFDHFKIDLDNDLEEYSGEPLSKEELLEYDLGEIASNLRLDSLDCVELVMEVEKKFGISIPDEEIFANKVFREDIDYLVNLIQRKVSEKNKK